MNAYSTELINKKNILFCFLSLFFLILVLMSESVLAAEIYMSKTGTKTSGKSTAGDWSNGNCYSTLRAAMLAMSGGDTLTINDGTYSGTANTIDQNNRPPSGSAGAFTTIRGRHIPCQEGYSCSSALPTIMDDFMLVSGAGSGASTYLKIYGLQINRANTYTGWDHIYWKQCAFMGKTDDNSAAAGIGAAHNLIEDSVFYGKGRYKLNFYDYTRELNTNGAGDNVCRRCIGRNDFALKDTDPTNPIALFSSYYNTGTAWLNCIDIDSDLPDYWKTNPEELASSFYQPFQQGALPHNLLIQGSMAINSALGGAYTEAVGAQITDFANIKTGGGFWLKDGGTINRATIVDMGLDNFTYSANQIAVFIARHYGIGGYNYNPTVTNSIMKDINPVDYIFLNTNPSYINTYTLGKPVNGTISNQITTNPSTNGLLYPVRIETGSTLKTAGSAGSQVGATILYKLGVDGTFKGDTDWNTEQGALWPWPLEDWVKAQMASMPATITGDAMPSAIRGFCAPGQTLTNYIWGSLGNIVPPFNLKATPATNTASNTTINLAWTLNTANPSVTGYKVYVGTSSGNYNLPGYVGGKNVGKVATTTITGLNPATLYYISVTAVDSNSSKESGYSYELVTTPLDTTPPTKQVTSTSVPSLSPSSGSGSSGGSGGGGCFIATAAYGSYLHPQVQILRNFRDSYLLTNSAGRAFVALYYQVSPPIADYIAGNDMLRFCVRLLLTPIVLMVAYPEASIVVVLCIFTCLLVRRRLSKSAPACNVSAC